MWSAVENVPCTLAKSVNSTVFGGDLGRDVLPPWDLVLPLESLSLLDVSRWSFQ